MSALHKVLLGMMAGLAAMSTARADPVDPNFSVGYGNDELEVIDMFTGGVSDVYVRIEVTGSGTGTPLAKNFTVVSGTDHVHQEGLLNSMLQYSITDWHMDITGAAFGAPMYAGPGYTITLSPDSQSMTYDFDPAVAPGESSPPMLFSVISNGAGTTYTITQYVTIPEPFSAGLLVVGAGVVAAGRPKQRRRQRSRAHR